HYHLGNGYRAYNPVLMRFTCPDCMSPFGEGGINPYAYCTGDPVNHADPTGHHSFWGWLGIVAGVTLGALLTPVSGGSSLAVALSVVSVSTAVASTGLAVAQQFVEESDPKTAAALGWAALGTGIISGLSSAALSRVAPGAKSLASLLKGRLFSSGQNAYSSAQVAAHDRVAVRGLGRGRLPGGGGGAEDASHHLWSERQVLIHEMMEHHFMPGNLHAMASEGLEVLEHVNLNAEYKPDTWTFYSAYRSDEGVLPPFYMSDIIEYQYTRVSTNMGFYGTFPSKIISKDVQNELTERLTRNLTGEELRTIFLDQTPVGRLAQRRANLYGLEITRVERQEGKYGPDFISSLRELGV
uniref:RHS repeat-associated core domain-containing protein n=1 Tax=Enterobacter bugandensis TaxID=881260 RepID=UPI000AE9CDA7